MGLYSYVVARDYGFAPNPFFGVCTLATCKPKIREAAKIGDWIVGTGSGERNREGTIVFGMCVAEALTFNEYWNDRRFQRKKPFLIGSKKQAYGDNIYFKDAKKEAWRQENSHHSLTDGSPNPKNVDHDTSVDRILVGHDFVYWGGKGPEIPEIFREKLCKRGPGHKSTMFSDDFTETVVAWLRSIGEWGYAGEPLDW